MDPLSVIASFIAVLQALTAAGKGVNKILDLRKAPVELQALFNEVQALRALLTDLQNAAHEVPAGSKESLLSLLEPVRNAVLDLDKLVQYQLTHAYELDQQGHPRVSKAGWLKASPRIEQIRQRIRDARGNLEAGLSAQSLSVVGATFRTTSEIQSIILDTSNELKTMHAKQQTRYEDLFTAIVRHDQSTALNQSIERLADRIEDLTTQQYPRVASLAEAVTFSPSETGAGRSVIPSDQQTMCITASVHTGRCPKRCPCQCHTRMTVRTPSVLQGIVGQLMFDYTYLVQPRSCDYPRCRKEKKRTSFTYFLPTWVASRAISIASLANDLSGVGASWSVKMPIVLDRREHLWTAIAEDKVRLVQEYFARREYSPYTMDKSGYTILFVGSVICV